MSDDRNVARDILVEAGKTILQNRPGVHGSAEQSFEMIGDLWTVYLRHTRRVRGTDAVQPEDVAQMMTLLKKARSLYGDITNRDNFVDDIGYAALAGMLQLPDPAKDPLDKLDPTHEQKPDWDEKLDTGIKHQHTAINHPDPDAGDADALLKKLYGKVGVKDDG